MKKRIIALSVAAALGGVAGSASAQTANFLSFNPEGVGHILIVPYFSTQVGNSTLLSVVNTDSVRGKAVKVRFRGASNSDDVFDFQLFLSPNDVWTARIFAGSDGFSRLETSDNSCTVPAKSVLNATPFIPLRLNPALTGDALAGETREGYVELLNMGDIPSVSGTTSVWFATKHNDAGVAPCTASILDTPGLSISDTRLLNPTTGLMGNWTIINVPNTTTWTGEAPAIQANVSVGVPGTGANVYWPQRDVPVPNAENFTADPLFRLTLVQAQQFDLPDLSTPYVLGTAGNPMLQANALSFSMATRTVATEFFSTSSIGASTDWVISKPTRRYYVAVDYSATAADEKIITNWDDFDDIGIYYRKNGTPDTGTFGTGGNLSLRDNGYQVCTTISPIEFYNREEFFRVSGSVISPGVGQAAPPLCGEVSVIGINSPTSPLGASLTRFNVTVPAGVGSEGWGRLTANNNGLGPNLGLPMLVRQFSKATNPAATPGTSGTYGGSWLGRVTERGVFFTP